MLEGWSRPQAFMRVVFPLLRNGIVATAVLCFIFAWNEFLFAFMLGGQDVQTLPVAMPKLVTAQGVRWGEMAVVGMVALVPVLVAVFAAAAPHRARADARRRQRVREASITHHHLVAGPDTVRWGCWNRRSRRCCACGPAIR